MIEDESKPVNSGWLNRLSEINVLVWVPLLLCFWIFIQLFLIIYSVYFGPLSNIPGPKLAAATYLYHNYHAGYGSDFYWRDVQELHKRYGPVVRISPSEVHLGDVNFAESICSKVNGWKGEEVPGSQPFGDCTVLAAASRSRHRTAGAVLGTRNSPRDVQHYTPKAAPDLKQLYRTIQELSKGEEPIRPSAASAASQKYSGGSSDNAVSVLASVLSHILMDQKVLCRLKTELKSAEVAGEDLSDYEKIERLPYLSAMITEGLRISLPTCDTVTKITPARKALIYKDIVIPFGTTISMSLPNKHLNEQSFSRPYDFIPERWLGLAKIANEKNFKPQDCFDTDPIYADVSFIITEILTHLDITLIEVIQATHQQDLPPPHTEIGYGMT